MVEVTAHEGGDIALVVVHELEGVVVGGLVVEPHVPQLIHHVHTQLVAGTEQVLGDGVVGAADGVEAVLLQEGYTAVGALLIVGRAHNTVVVVDAAALQEHTLPVHEETVLAPGNLAHAEGHFLHIATGEGDAGLVQMGRFGRP